jgi:hypothetical protein
MLAEWTGLEPATPGVTGRHAAWSPLLINELQGRVLYQFAQFCPVLSSHVGQKWDIAKKSLVPPATNTSNCIAAVAGVLPGARRSSTCSKNALETHDTELRIDTSGGSALVHGDRGASNFRMRILAEPVRASDSSQFVPSCSGGNTA